MKKEMHGWTGKILRVDLSNRRTEIEDTANYAYEYIGGRGIATRIAWNELRPGCGPFDEDNLLLIFTGPLTGTSAPYSGRTTICSVAPQAYPTPWFSRGSLGGHWGPELKYAGFDGIVVKGIADAPVYLYIEDGKVSIEDAHALWGLGIYDTQAKLFEKHGKDLRVITIGQTGENLSRLAIISTETESAVGQGGYGAVMGSKKLKAIAVRGRGRLSIAQPQEFARKCRAIAKESHGSHGWPHDAELDPEKVARYGMKFQACTQGCAMPCRDARYYTRVPGVIHKDKMYAGQMDCIATLFPGIKGTFYDWQLGFEAGFEISTMSNDYGVNQWDFMMGIIPWLRDCRNAGLIADLDGRPINFDDPYFWADMLRKLTFREGIGDALAEGGQRMPGLLGFGQDLIQRYYTGWGFAGHWDGHADKINYIYYPYWIVAALQWAMDTRDPISSGHGYVQAVMCWSPDRSPDYGISWEAIKEIGTEIYGTPDAVDPESGYAAKEIPAVFHGNRSALKDSLPIDDQVFPRIFSRKTEDHRPKADGMRGLSFEYELFISATGMDISEEEFNRMSERIVQLDRAIQVRHYGRERENDESVITAFTYPENVINPFIGKPIAMDREKFLEVMDRYYRLRGWDVETGAPLPETLRQVGLGDVAEVMGK